LFGWDLTQKYMPLNVIKNILSHRKEWNNTTLRFN
jgi:hypothetical protein